MALSAAHDMACASNWNSAPIGDVIEATLASHRTGEGRLNISGPGLNVAPKQAFALTLAVNELATNAMKYGALSVSDGKIDISWTAISGHEPTFEFIWREHGGPTVVAPARQGFKSRVIKDFMANDFGGVVQLSYQPAGFVCTLKAPLGNLSA